MLTLYWGPQNHTPATDKLVQYGDELFYRSAGEQKVASPISPIPLLKTLPPELQQKVALGRALFADVRLSGKQNVACISCHLIAIGGHDPRGISPSADDKPLPRNTPTVLNAAFNLSQFWDGRAPTLFEQVQGPLLSGKEMDGKIEEIIPRLQSDPEMVQQFSIYPQGITLETISDAISLYERTLITPNSPFDRYLLGEENAINETQKQGYALFVQRGCISCHQGRNVGGGISTRKLVCTVPSQNWNRRLDWRIEAASS